jgi:sigma-B regulation protein RsbU (phosphoserine phosphatase)
VFNGQFVTMQIVVLDVEQGVIDIATAGHPPPLVGGADAFRELAVEPQLMLAVEHDTTFQTQRFELPRGASLLLYTDGVPDALSPGGERFRTDGLIRSLYGRYEHAQGIIDTVVDAVDRFRGAHELTDDVTLVAVQFHSARAGRESARDDAAAFAK